MNALRKELADILATAALARNPALRRSMREEWLYAADLPGLCPPEEMETLLRKLKETGWEAAADGGWVQFRKSCPYPPEGWYAGSFGPEAACCGSLLRRHPGGDFRDGERVRFRLIKSAEEGAGSYERACAALHREWAERLRKGKKLPAVSRKYFGEEDEGGDSPCFSGISDTRNS